MCIPLSADALRVDEGEVAFRSSLGAWANVDVCQKACNHVDSRKTNILDGDAGNLTVLSARVQHEPWHLAPD